MAARAIHRCGRAVQRLQRRGALIHLLLGPRIILALWKRLRALVLEGLGLRGGYAGLVDLVFVFFVTRGHVGERRLGGLDAVGVLVREGWGLDELLLTLLGDRVAV